MKGDTDMKKRGLALLLGAALMAGACGVAEETGATYVFPYEGLRYTQYTDETVLTQTNLDEHGELIASLGTTQEAILANYIASGIVMEIIPDEGGQIAVSVADAGEFSGAKSMDELGAEGIARFAAQFEESGLYETCEVLATTPVCVRLTSSATYGGMPVYALKYATLHLGRLYMFTQTIVGREPGEADDARMERMLAGIRLLTTLPELTPSPTPIPTPETEPTPQPTPGEAAVTAQEGEITVNGVPAFTAANSFYISGEAVRNRNVTAKVGEEVVGSTTAKSDGKYSMRIKLSQEGRSTIRVACGDAYKEFSVYMDLPDPEFEFVEMESTTFTGERLLVRGKTVPGARIRVTGDGVADNNVANTRGVFSLRLDFKSPGTKTVTFTVTADGYAKLEFDMDFTRVFTEREFANDFRSKMIELDYEDFLADPVKYNGKRFIFRGRVEDFADFDGRPCALVCVERDGDVWRGPVWVVLDGTEGLAVGHVATFYLTGNGLTLPADGKYTLDGADVEAPAAYSEYVTNIE